MIAKDLTEDQIKRYRLVDNRAAELSQWDMTKLVQEMREVEDFSDLEGMFKGMNIDKMLNDSMPVTKPEDLTNEKIQERQVALDQTYNNVNAEAEEGLIDFTCPNCGKEFSVQKEYVKKKYFQHDEFHTKTEE